ncbi:PepSY domain-containing protein [Methanofollis ethanolicus]|uniref:PepSY domain-containing protein n=1 Tax=Methanofollis ethanolicus TaxID=488124 RepID=UPI00082956CB|nr:PepSY domain-containing protein [Methanofollis ethanolicus]
MSKKIIGILIIICAVLALILIAVPGLSGAGNPIPPPNPPTTDIPATTPIANATGITGDEAKAIAIAAFPAIIGVDTAEFRLIDQPHSRRSWQVDDFSADLGMPGTRNAQVWVDANTGEIYQFAVHAGKQGRPVDPAITMEEACTIAERYIGNRSDGEPLELLVKRYDAEESPLTGKVAGTYFIRYGRLIHSVPSATDGHTVEVDAVTGEIRQFSIDRETDEEACRVATDPSVSSAQAEEVLKKYLQETYGDLPGLTIHETGLRWAVPRAYPDYPDGVPLIWQISFDDDHYHSLTCPHYTYADIDAHTGDVLSCYYRPDAT